MRANDTGFGRDAGVRDRFRRKDARVAVPDARREDPVMTTRPDSSPDSEGGAETRELLLELEIRLQTDCPVTEYLDDAVKIRHIGSSDGNHCEVLTGGGEDRAQPMVHHVDCPISTTCLYSVFGEVGCVPQIVDVANGGVVVQTYVEDHDAAWELLASLKEVEQRARLRRITTEPGDNEIGETLPVDLSSLTAKQRMATEAAYRAGYFERPREVTLEELADEFGISTSAFAQRLATAQKKLMTQLFDGGPEEAE